MSDAITIRGTEAKYHPHPEGQFVAVCADVINLGEKVEQYADTPPKLTPKIALVFRTGERNESTGDFIDISREFTASMGEKANLRKFLEQWRGRPYTPQQVTDGVPVDKLTGQPGLLTIAHRVSGQQRTYANITACVGVPKQLHGSLPSTTGYVRAEYWQTMKDEYAAAARKLKSEQEPPPSDQDFGDFPEDDDELPF